MRAALYAPGRMGRPGQMMKLSGRAFTLIELLLAFAILAFCLMGILLTYINMFVLADLARDFTLVTNAMQAQLEEIKKTPFDNLLALNGNTFDIAGFSSGDAKGRIEVCDNTTCPAFIPYSDLKRVRLVVSFRSRGRVIGEDSNLNGILNSGEDTLISNNRMDSPSEIVTLIVR